MSKKMSLVTIITCLLFPHHWIQGSLAEARLDEVVTASIVAAMEAAKEPELKRKKDDLVANVTREEQANWVAPITLALDNPARFAHWKYVQHQVGVRIFQELQRESISKVDLEAHINSEGWTTLHGLIDDRFLAGLKLLLAQGAHFRVADGYGDTLLHVAALRGQVECVKVLLEAGFDINVCNMRGETPLHFAAFSGKDAVVNILLRRGALHEKEDKDGSTAYHLARAMRRNACVQTFEMKARVNDGVTPMHIIAAKNLVSLVPLWARYYYNLNVIRTSSPVLASPAGSSPLHIAARAGHRKLIEALLLEGASKMVKDGNGALPLDIAKAEGHSECVELLSSDGSL